MPLQGASPPSEQAGPALPSSRDSRSTITAPPLLSTSSPPSPSRRPRLLMVQTLGQALHPRSREVHPQGRPRPQSVLRWRAYPNPHPPPHRRTAQGPRQASQPSGRGRPRQRPDRPTRIGRPGAVPEEGQGHIRGRGASHHGTASKTHRLLRQEDHRSRPGQRARAHGKLIPAFIH